MFQKKRGAAGQGGIAARDLWRETPGALWIWRREAKKRSGRNEPLQNIAQMRG